MKPGRILTLIGLALWLSSGCATKQESAKAALQELKDSHQIDEVSVNNFVICAQMGNRDAIHLYLDSGMDINVRNSEGRTPLMGAVAADPNVPWFSRNEEIVRFLIQNGANVNAIDNYGYSALKLAKDMTRLQIAKILEEAGAREYPNGVPTPTPSPESTAGSSY